MLINGQDLLDIPVMSLQTGSELARTASPVINPHNLTVPALSVHGPMLDQEASFLRIADIREVSPIGIIVDSSDEFVILDDIIKLKEIYELQFLLERKPVINERREKIGKILDFTIETSGFVIQQLIIKRPLLKSFNDSELVVHRSQVVEITDEVIIIKEKAATNEPLPKNTRSYMNPFRGTVPQVEATRSNQSE